MAPKLLRLLDPVGVQVDRDDPGRPVEAGHRHHGESHRTGTDHRDHVPGLHLPVLDPDLESRRQNVAEKHALVVRDALGHLVNGCLGIRHPHVLGLGAIDQVRCDLTALKVCSRVRIAEDALDAWLEAAGPVATGERPVVASSRPRGRLAGPWGRFTPGER